ncbi:hypothetical protein [Citrifermentans bemidjiense]|uniref:hypothetical protein n=1 Tax=Citrifermentans bemidjiense TaxID=225194 RepID=UPI00059C9773|nr:hypothetical protein [Citrifermentans bemidjiense]
MNYIVECFVRKPTDRKATGTVKLLIQTDDEGQIYEIAKKEVAKNGYMLVRLGRILENETVSF